MGSNEAMKIKCSTPLLLWMPGNQPDWYGFGRICEQTASSTTAVLLELLGRARGDLTAVEEGGAGGPGAHLRQALVCLVDLNTWPYPQVLRRYSGGVECWGF